MNGFIYRSDLLGKSVIGFCDGDYILEICGRGDIEGIITKNHYSKTMPRNSKHHFLVYYKRSIEGAISLGCGIRPQIKTAWGNIESGTSIEFDRMWLSDTPPKNSESKVISMLVKL